MDILRKYLLSSAATMIPRMAEGDPPGDPDPAAEPVAPADPVAVDPEPAGDPEPAPEPEPKAAVPRVSNPLIDTVTALRAKVREVETDAAQARREAQEARELLARQNAPKDPAAPPAPAAPRSVASSLDEEVDRRAEHKLFVRDVGAVRDAAFKEFGTSFNESIRALGAYGADTDEFLSQVLAVDKPNAHHLLKAIADDPERAVSLVGMNPTARIAELTRMAMAAAPAKTDPKPAADPKPAEPAKPAISRAPAPKPALTPRAPAAEVDPTTPEGDEKMSAEEWNAWYAKKYLKKTG